MCEDAGFTRTVFAGQFFVTRSTIKLEGFGVTSLCRENTQFRDEVDSCPKAAHGSDTKNGFVFGVVVTKQEPIRSRNRN